MIFSLPLCDTFSLPNFRRFSYCLAGLLLLCANFSLQAADFEVSFANLHNPYFPDRLPVETPGEVSNYIISPAPRSLFGIEGDHVSVPFTVVSKQRHGARITARIFENGREVASLGNSHADGLILYRAVDNFVEGNSNGSCSCPAGLSLGAQDGKAVCGVTGTVSDGAIPKGCPTSEEHAKIAATLIRTAPFHVKDALLPVLDPASADHALKNGTELFVLEVPITANLPKGLLELRIEVLGSGDAKKTIRRPLQVLPIKLDNFPVLDLSYWSSEDPRDLVERPPGVALNAHWGGEWWSEEHWRGIERLAAQLAKIGVTNSLVPLFVRNPFGINATPLIPVKCIGEIGNRDLPSGSQAGVLSDSFGFEFDFSGFRRWVSIFRQAGFRNFEGGHLFANGGAIPNFLECDVYKSPDDEKPYKKGARFLWRKNPEALGTDYAVEFYKTKFLPKFLRSLSAELNGLGIESSYIQHLIDENSSSAASELAYQAAVRIVRSNLPNVRTIDAINQYNAPRYSGLVDIPVVHLILVYDDQGRRRGIRGEVGGSFPGRKYFYNTALRRGGPNRFMDTNPLDSRVYGWLALELGYNGILYWASNSFRYPKGGDLSAINRSPDWSPYNFSLGPMPNGSASPGYGAGGNWIFFPTKNGLTDSLRARRLREGLLDHWVYSQALRRCQSEGRVCYDKLANILSRIMGDGQVIADFSHNPEDYDLAREDLLNILAK